MRRNQQMAAWGVAVLLLGGILAAVTHKDEAPTSVRTASTPAPVVEDEPTTTTAAPTVEVAAAEAKPADPAPAAKPAPAPAPKPAAPAAPKPATYSGKYGPRPPGSVAFPADPNRTSWTATSNGVTLTVSIDRQNKPVGDPVSFNLSATTTKGSCCGLFLLYGDGAKFDQQPTEPCGGPGQPGSRSATATHPFNKPGKWELMFQASTGDCSVHAAMFFWVYVTPGTPTSQGPALPTIRGAWAYAPNEPSFGMTAKVGGHGHDDDGFVHHFSINWGDGAVDTSPGDYMGCRPTTGGWPATSDAWYPPNGSKTPPAHTYAAEGEYTVVVTVHSIGCDGRMEQTASWTGVWRTGGPNP